MPVALATRITEESSVARLSEVGNVIAPWASTMLDELAAQLAVHPVVEALVQARVEEALSARSARQWYTTKEAGERLGCSMDAVRMRFNRGRLKGKRQGRTIYIAAVSVDALAQAA